MKRLILSALCVLFTSTVQAELLFDVTKTTHQFTGLGTQIWASDMSVEPVLKDLNIKIVRMDIGKIPKNLDVSTWGDDEYAEFYAVKARIKHHLKSWDMLKKYGVSVVINPFSVSREWTIPQKEFAGRKVVKNTLSPDFYPHYTKRLAAGIAAMHQEGIDIIGVEAFNEPDGTWDCYVPPEEYGTFVIMLRHELDKRGLTAVKIVGPGLAHIDTKLEEPWMHSLSQKAVDAIGVWSAHGYHWDVVANQQLHSIKDAFRDGLMADILVKDPDREKPVYITEFSPLKVWEDDGGAIETDEFATRAAVDALSFLNGGANSIFFWEAADMHWSKKRKHGLLRLDKSKRPIYYALQTIFEHWPVNSQLLQEPDGNLRGICAGAVIDSKHNKLVLSLVNATKEEQIDTIVINSGQKILAEKSVMFHDAKSFNVPLPAFTNNTLKVTLPPYSIQTIVCSND